MAAHRTAKINLTCDSFYFLPNISKYFGKILTAEPKHLFYCALYAVLMLNLDSAGAGIFFLLVQQSWHQTALVDHKLLFFMTLFSHTKLQLKVKIFLFSYAVETVTMVEQSMLASCIFILFPVPHCRSSSNCSWQVWVQSVKRSIQNWWLLKSWVFFTKYGKLGSMQNFQMGNSSSMYSWERDVNSNPEKVNDALT